MEARWFICSLFVAVLTSFTQGQVLGRMRHVASPSQESCNTLDDLFSLLSLARALEEKSTGRLTCTYCPDDVIMNLVNALVYTATAHVCSEPWNPTTHTHQPYLPTTSSPLTTLPGFTMYSPCYPSPTTHSPATNHLPPSTHQSSPTHPTYPPTNNQSPISCHSSSICDSNTTDNTINPIDNEDQNHKGNLGGNSHNSQVTSLLDIDESSHLGVDVNGIKHSGDDNSGKNKDEDNHGTTKTEDDNGENTQKGVEDVSNSLFGIDISGSQNLDLSVGKKKEKSSQKQ